jgi:hypothetical protein
VAQEDQMKLETSNMGELNNPSAIQIAEALVQLPGGSESFAILGSGTQTYVQVAGSAKEGFAIEYRDGDETRHFEAIEQPITLELAQGIFQRYAAGDDSWRSMVAWRPWGAGTAGSSRISVGLVAGIIAVVMVAVALAVAT